VGKVLATRKNATINRESMRKVFAISNKLRNDKFMIASHDDSLAGPYR